MGGVTPVTTIVFIIHEIPRWGSIRWYGGGKWKGVRVSRMNAYFAQSLLAGCWLVALLQGGLLFLLFLALSSHHLLFLRHHHRHHQHATAFIAAPQPAAPLLLNSPPLPPPPITTTPSDTTATTATTTGKTSTSCGCRQQTQACMEKQDSYKQAASWAGACINTPGQRPAHQTLIKHVMSSPARTNKSCQATSGLAITHPFLHPWSSSLQ